MLKNKKKCQTPSVPGICMYLVPIIYKQSKFRSEIFDTLSDFNFLIIHISNPGFTTEKPTLSFSAKKHLLRAHFNNANITLQTALNCFISSLLSEKKSNGEGDSEADPTSLFLV